MSASRMPDSDQIKQVVWDGQEMRPGSQITFDVRVWGTASTQHRDERRVGTIRELWVDNHPNMRGHGVFAEVDGDDGAPCRVWFYRDKPTLATGMEAIIGAEPEGALF